jgi:hypothetical protein
MKKLEDIPKNDPFKVPDGYFENLPSRIQSRIGAKAPNQGEESFATRFKLAYVMPAVVLLLVAIFWFRQNNADPKDTEAILATIPTEALIAYLNEDEISTDDILQDIEFTDEELEEIESEVFQLPFGPGEIDLTEEGPQTDSL